MNRFEILRFTFIYSTTPNESVLVSEEEGDEQTLYLQEQQKNYCPTDHCCGQYRIDYVDQGRLYYGQPDFRERLKELLSRQDVQRQLGDLKRLKPVYKQLIAEIMDEIKGK